MTTFSPVTEQEMQDFLNRAVATVREYTNLSSTLDQMRSEMESLRVGLADTRAENDKLRDEARQTTELAKSYESERDEARRRHEDEIARTRNLQDLITARDSRVQELQQNLDTSNNRATSLDNECTRLNNTLESKERQIDILIQKRDGWKARAEVAEEALADAKADLAKVEQAFNAMNIFKPKAVPEVAKETEANPTQASAAPTSGTTTLQVPFESSSSPEMKPVIHDEDVEHHPDWQPRPPKTDLPF